MTSESDRIKNYKESSDDIRQLYSAPESGALMFVIFQKFNLEEIQYKSYAEIVGDCILGFYKIADMPRLFQQKLTMSADEAQRLTSSLIEFLAPVVQREEVEEQAKKFEMGALAETLSMQAPERLQNPDIQKLTENVEPLRTMQTDINRIHGYGAYNAQKDADSGISDASVQPQNPV